jgi:hypothetical protein
MNVAAIEKIIKIVKVIRDVSDMELKDCALDSLIENLEDMMAEAIQKGEF